MFLMASSFDQPLSSWNVANVEDLRFMFLGALAFNQDLSTWDVSNVVTIESMFFGTAAFNGVISQWNVENCIYISGLCQIIQSGPFWVEGVRSDKDECHVSGRDLFQPEPALLGHQHHSETNGKEIIYRHELPLGRWSRLDSTINRAILLRMPSTTNIPGNGIDAISTAPVQAIRLSHVFAICAHGTSSLSEWWYRSIGPQINRVWIVTWYGKEAWFPT